jgi:hypothetical protein
MWLALIKRPSLSSTSHPFPEEVEKEYICMGDLQFLHKMNISYVYIWIFPMVLQQTQTPTLSYQKQVPYSCIHGISKSK